MSVCNICPRKCNAERLPLAENGEGFCGLGGAPRIARAALHFWEEPPISGENGSGTVFFSGCNLGCIFCQNKKISRGRFGKTVTPERLREIYEELINKGAHNINLVTPTHFADAVLASLEPKLAVPVVYNCGGYESVETLKRFEGKIQIYLPDIKYSDNVLAKKYSAAPDYFETAKAAVKEMYRQTGKYDIGDDGIMKKGIIIRHLILPGQLENTKKVIDWVKNEFAPGEVLFSLMSQFTPVEGCNTDELYRRLTKDEYSEIADYLFESGIEDGFMQELSSAKEEYIPQFDLEGV